MRKSTGSSCIFPNKALILILLIATIGSALLILGGYKGHAPIAVSPVLLVVIGILGLVYHCRIIELDQESITVHYCLLFLRRKIRWERVHSVEYVCQRYHEYLLITVDNCQSFFESGKKLDAYLWRHPIKLLAFHFTSGNPEECLNLFRSYGVDVHFFRLTENGKICTENQRDNSTWEDL